MKARELFEGDPVKLIFKYKWGKITKIDRDDEGNPTVYWVKTPKGLFTANRDDIEYQTHEQRREEYKGRIRKNYKK